MGAKEPAVQGPEEALDLVAAAKSRRATASTAANATSSRSHCVTRVTVWSEAFGQGQLTLVDCAGSERNNDSMYHDAQARKESAEINASLYALRECIRLRRRQAEEAQQPNGGKHVHVPYRSSQLTRVLMECFMSPDAAVAVIATVSGPLPCWAYEAHQALFDCHRRESGVRKSLTLCCLLPSALRRSLRRQPTQSTASRPSRQFS